MEDLPAPANETRGQRWLRHLVEDAIALHEIWEKYPPDGYDPALLERLNHEVESINRRLSRN